MQEIEATLIICSDTPSKVLDNIAAQRSIGIYPLEAGEPAYIHDYYVDTTEKALHRMDYTMRLRVVNSSQWLTVKGPKTILSPGIVQRGELELPWSEESLNRVTEELANGGVALPAHNGTPPNAEDPLESLSCMGLKTVQHRQNYRQIRNVLPSREPGEPVLAEVSLDSVVYHIGGREIRHYEVEIEAKSESGVPELPSLTQDLIDICPEALQRWDYGKLAIGKAVKTMLESGQLESLLDADQQLKPSAYPKMFSLLSQDRQ